MIMYALFNKEKLFIGYSPDNPPETLLKREIREEQSDFNLWGWIGDFDTGEMKPIDIGYPISEIEMEKKLFKFIEKEYPLGIQLQNIIRQLVIIVRSNDSLQDDIFMDMADVISNAIEKHDRRIKYYRAYSKLSPNEQK